MKDLLAERIDVMVATVNYERDHEFLVQKIAVPATAQEGAPVPARVMVWSSHDGVKTRVRLIVDGTEAAALDATLSQGSNVYALTLPFTAP